MPCDVASFARKNSSPHFRASKEPCVIYNQTIKKTKNLPDIKPFSPKILSHHLIAAFSIKDHIVEFHIRSKLSNKKFDQKKSLLAINHQVCLYDA